MPEIFSGIVPGVALWKALVQTTVCEKRLRSILEFLNGQFEPRI